MTTEVLGIDELVVGQAGKETTHNDALRQIEGRLVRVLSRVTTAEPSAPTDGDTYLIPAGATGTSWATYAAGSIAHYYGGAWHAWAPVEGVCLRVVDESQTAGYPIEVAYVNGSWVTQEPKDNMGASADPTAADDSTAGYRRGSKWYNTSTEKVFVCIDPSAGAAVWANTTLTLSDLGSAATKDTTDFLQPTNNLSDVGDAPTARTNLGLGDAATHPASDFATDAQGAEADTAVQPSDLAAVATSGAAADVAATTSDDRPSTDVDGQLSDLESDINGLSHIQVFPDSGRFAGNTQNPLATTVGSFVGLPSPISLRNGASGPTNAGQFINNNSTYGGTAGALTTTVQDLLTAMGRTGNALRYGPEFYVAEITAGSGTTVAAFNAPASYGISQSLSPLMGIGGWMTLGVWARCVSGGPVYLDYQNNSDPHRIFLDDSLLSSYGTLSNTDGWKHITYQLSVAVGWAGTPIPIFANNGDVIQFALMSVFTGKIRTGMYVSPIPTINQYSG